MLVLRVNIPLKDRMRSQAYNSVIKIRRAPGFHRPLQWKLDSYEIEGYASRNNYAAGIFIDTASV